MNKRTKLFVGIALLVSAFTTMFTFISLCFKKKGMLTALAAFATAEGLIGLALIEDNSKRRPKTAAEVDAEILAAKASLASSTITPQHNEEERLEFRARITVDDSDLPF